MVNVLGNAKIVFLADWVLSKYISIAANAVFRVGRSVSSVSPKCYNLWQFFYKLRHFVDIGARLSDAKNSTFSAIL